MKLDIDFSNIDNLSVLEDKALLIYQFISEEKFTAWESIKFFSNIFENKIFLNNFWDLIQEMDENSHQFDWSKERITFSDKQEYFFIKLLFQILWVIIFYIQDKLTYKNREEITKIIHTKCYLFWIDVPKMSFTLIEILSNPSINHIFDIKLMNGLELEKRKLFYATFQLIWKSSLSFLFLNLSQKKILSIAIKKTVKKIEKIKYSWVYKDIYSACKTIDWGIDYASRNINDFWTFLKLESIFIDEIIVRKVILEVTQWIQTPLKKDWDGTTESFLLKINNMIINKIQNSNTTYENIILLSKKLSFFSDKDLWSEYYNYSDKIYLISIKWVSILLELKKSSTDEWRINTFMRECYNWINELLEIINRYANQEWDLLEKFLQNESTQIEWKSTLFTSIQNDKINTTSFKKNNIKKISETIVSMMNTDWWKIIIWYIEHYDLILDVYKNKILKKQDYRFYDISTEFDKFSYSIDKMIRDINDIIWNEIINPFSDYWENFEIKFINLGLEFDSKIILIDVQKSEKLLISRLDKISNSIFVRIRTWARNWYEKPEICFNLLDN